MALPLMLPYPVLGDRGLYKTINDTVNSKPPSLTGFNYFNLHRTDKLIEDPNLVPLISVGGAHTVPPNCTQPGRTAQVISLTWQILVDFKHIGVLVPLA